MLRALFIFINAALPSLSVSIMAGAGQGEECLALSAEMRGRIAIYAAVTL